MLIFYSNAQAKDIQKSKDKTYISRLWEGLESQLASIAFISFSIINLQHVIKDCLKSHLLPKYHQSLETQSCTNQSQGSRSNPTTSSLFTNAFNNPNFIFIFVKVSSISHPLWHGYHHYLGIKYSRFAACNLCKYILVIFICIIVTGKERLEPDIKPKTSYQAKSLENIIKIMWNAEAI